MDRRPLDEAERSQFVLLEAERAHDVLRLAARHRKQSLQPAHRATFTIGPIHMISNDVVCDCLEIILSSA